MGATRLEDRSAARLAGIGWLVAALLALGLILGLPQLVAIAAPFAVALVVGVATADPVTLTVAMTLDRNRVLEGEVVTIRLAVTGPRSIERVELSLPIPDALVSEGPARAALRLQRGRTATVDLQVRGARWGALRLGPVEVRARGWLGLVEHRGWAPATSGLRVYPGVVRLQTLLVPRRTLAHAGNQRSRQRGEGIEFADLRPFGPGDRIRGINWRATARRGMPFVSLRHPERNSDLVLFLDTFRDVRLGMEGTLDLAVRGVGALAGGYLQRRDRLGLVGFGGVIRWLAPDTGLAQLYRVVDALLDTEVVLSYAWKDLDVLPRRMLPPAATIVAFSPLLDPRAIRALLDCAARGYDVAVVEVDPEGFAPPPGDRLEQLAVRLWRLVRAARREELRRAGVAVASWSRDQPLDPVLQRILVARRPPWRATA